MGAHREARGHIEPARPDSVAPTSPGVIGAGRPGRTTQVMPVSLRFRCQYCDERPDPLTHINLVTAMRETTFGEYQDALPGRWLIFHVVACSVRRAMPARHTAAISWRSCASTTARSAIRCGGDRPTRRASRTPTSTAHGSPPRPARRAGSEGPQQPAALRSARHAWAMRFGDSAATRRRNAWRGSPPTVTS